MASLSELKMRFDESFTNDDIVMAIFDALDIEELPRDPAVIHKAMYQIKVNHSDSDLFKDFQFDISGIAPFSSLLDQVIFRLETAHILSTLNPSYEKYRMEKSELSKSYKKFKDDKSEIIDQAANEFSNYIR